VEAPAFAWNHGDVQPDITTTWLGMAGPGVLPLGVTKKVWSDHTDIRPTMLSLLGMHDDYTHDGRVLSEFTDSASTTSRDLLDLARIYKQLNAPVGLFGLGVLRSTTKAIQRGDAAAYAQEASKLEALGQERDEVASAIRVVLEHAASPGNDRGGDVAGLISRARRLLADAGRSTHAAESDEDGQGGQ
jgi:hypothetical protein